MKKNLIAVLLIIALGIVCYANSLPNDFVWDDGQLIKDNLFIRSLNHLPQIFTTDLHHFSFEGSNFYRPIQTISYLLDYQLWKLRPFGYHLTNLILHLISAILLYFLIKKIFSQGKLALITALLFVASPLNTQAVSYISGRADSLAALFIIAAFLLYLYQRRGWSLLCFIFAGLSKETALVFPLLLIIYELIFDKKLKNTIPYCLISIGFIILRLSVLKFDLRTGSLITESLGVRAITLSRALVSYLRLLVWPVNLHMQYQVPFIRSIFNVPAALSIILLISLIAAIFISYKKSKIVFFGLTWFFITLLPVSNILIPVNAVLAEHWLYMPAIGIFLIFSHSLLNLSKRSKPLLVTCSLFLVTILCFYSWFTIARNKDWSDRITLYQATIKFAPGSAQAHYNLANAYSDLGRNQEAIAEYQRTIEIEPRYAAAHNNLASAYLAIGDYRNAILEYIAALRITPDLKEAYNNLGYAYNNLGMNNEAIVVLNKAISIEPSFAVAYNNLGNAYLGKKDVDQAVNYWQKSLELSPGYRAAKVNLENAQSYREKLKPDSN